MIQTLHPKHKYQMLLKNPDLSITEILSDTLKRFNTHEGAVRSGYIAFCMLLGFFPFMIFLAHLSAFLLGEDESKKIVNTLISFAPDYLKAALKPTIETVLTKNRVDVMSFALLASIWFPSKALDGLRIGFDHAYGDKTQQGWLMGRLISMVFVVVGVIVSIVLSTLVILGPVLTRLVEAVFHFEMPFLIDSLRNTAGFFMFLIFSWCLHRFLPSRHFSAENHIWSGVIIGSILWIAVAIAFGIYLNHSSHYQIFYGTLAGVAITMVFFYFTCVIFLFSAEINATLDTGHSSK